MADKKPWEMFAAPEERGPWSQFSAPAAAEPPKEKGFLSNIGSLIYEGGERAIGAAKIAPSVVTGDVGADKAKLLAQELSRPEGVRPPELVEAQKAFKEEAAAFEKAKGFTESAGPVADMLLEFGKQAITNPKGAAYLAAQSAANMAPQIAGMIAGGKGGAALGSLGGPGGAAIGAGVGAIGGGFAAGAPLEVGSEFIGRIGDTLRERGLEPTEENVAAILRDRRAVEQAVGEARTKGVTTAAIDSLMTVGAGRFATGTRRAAIDAARKELGATADAAKIAARADDLLAARTTGQKVQSAVGRGAGSLGIDVAGGGASEAAGQAAAYGKVNLEDVGQEMLGSLGGAAVEIPAAAYSTATDAFKKPTAEAPLAPPAPQAPVAPRPAARIVPPPVEPAVPEAPVVEPTAALPVEPAATVTPVEPAAPAEPIAPTLQAPKPEVPKATDWSDDYTENLSPEAGTFFQNRDRSAPASVGQMQSIAANPDYSRLSVSRDFGSGAPVVISDVPISEDQFGKVAYATASDGTRIPVRYAVVEGNDITPSNTSDGTKNPEYGDLSVSAIRPIAGNGRVAGLRAAYSQGTAENYKRELLEDVEHGIDPGIIGGFENPVLVRVMPKSKVTPNIADISNISGTLRLSPVESAKNDISRVDLNGLSFNDDGSPNTNTLIQFVRSMPKDEQGELIDAKGMPNTKAIDRLNNAIFYKAYGSDNLIELYAQAADPEAKAVLNALAKAAPKMAALEGAGEYDVRASVLDAAEMAVNARRAGQKLKDYAQQGVLGADPYALKVLDMFADNSRSSKRMAEALDRLATLAGEQASASSTDMFGDVPKMPKDDLYKALALEPEAAPDLFATPPAAPEVAAPAAAAPAPAPVAPAAPAKPKAAKPVEPKAPEPTEPTYDKTDKPEFTIDKSMEEIAKEIGGMTIPQLAQWTVDNAPNEAARAIAQKVTDRIKEFDKKKIFPEKVKVLNGGQRSKSGVRGTTATMWVKGTGLFVKIRFNGLVDGKADSKTGTRYLTVLHELVHAATSAQVYLAPDSKAINDLKVLFKKVEDKIGKDRASGKSNYAITRIDRGANIMKNPSELMAWGLTDSEFQKFLADIKIGDKTGFQKLVEIVRQVLGLSKDYESALDALVRTSETIMGLSPSDVDLEMKPSGVPLKGVKIKGGRIMLPEGAGKAEDAAKAPPTNSAAFKRWFGDSKVVDENGRPLVVYHGTASDFSAFAEEKLGVNTRDEEGELGFFFTAKPFLSDSYAEIASRGGWSNKTEGGAPVVYPVYLSIKNPKRYETASSFYRDAEKFKGRLNQWRKELEEQGFDGVIVRGDFEEVIAFRPTQVKSATGNVGTYSPTSGNISEERQGKPTPTEAGQDALATLDATGMQLQPPDPSRIESIKKALKAAGEDPALTKDSAKAAVKKFLDKMEVAAFSGDAAFNNDIRRNLEKDFADNPEVLGMLLEASQSQAVHADALATRFIVDGGVAFDPETKKWVAIKKENNFIKLAKQIEKVSDKYGLTKEQAEQVAHTYFVAKRFKDLLKKQRGREAEIERLQGELEDENANIKQYKKDGDFEKLRTSERAKNDIANDIKKLEKASVFISADQIAMIEPGMSLAKNMPELEEISDTWQGIRANAVKAMIDGNLWSMEYAESMLDNAAYVPFYRDEQLDEGGGPQEFIKGMQVKAAEFRLKGSNAAVNDVFDNMVRWTQYAINRSIRNHKALQMVDIGTELKVGDRKMAEKVEKMDPKKNTIRVFRDGTQEIYSMADPLYVDAFSAISNVTIPSLKFFTWFSNMLRQSVVLYPLFSVAQVPQDAISAMFTSGLKTRYALRIPVLAVKEFLKTLTKTSATHKLLESYGATGVRDFNATVARNDIQIAAGLKGAKGLGGKTFEFLSHVAMAADNSIRQAVYEASMQQGLSKGEAVEKAFDIINFRRRGTSKLVNLAGQTVPFFYAYMSVQRTAYKVLTGVGISPQQRKEALATLATTSGAVMALSLFYVMMNGGDEEYEKTPPAIRDRTLNIPGTGGLRIPLRPDLFLMPKVLTEHLYHLITDTGLSDGTKFRKSVADGVANAVLSPQPIPQAVKPALEVAINYDFFQGRPLIGQFEKQKEAERQFNDNTSEFSKMLGQFGVSPIAADHVIRGMFGSAGGLFLYTTNFMVNSDPDVPRPELSFRDAMAALPGTSGFVTKASENALKTDFYALRDEVEKVKNTYNDIKLRSPQELEQFLSNEKNIARLGLAKGTEKIGSELSKIRKAINQITNAPEDLYSASEKKDAIKELREVEKEMLKSIDIPALRKEAMM